MAKIKTDEESIEVEDGKDIIDACEEMGIPFGCTSGVCGTCVIRTTEGAENLTEPTDAEKDFGVDLDAKERLACQCKIKQGEVKIEFD